MVVTLTDAAKNWLAINAGTGECLAPSGVSYTDAEGALHTGSTGDIVNAFWVANSVGYSTAPIIAGMNYAGFKAINGGVDITIGTSDPLVIDGDVKWAYANDGSPIGESLYCAPPANIISTALTLDKSICAEPCTVGATITWTNTGALPGTFSPGVIVDSGTPTEMSPESLAAGATVSHTFSIAGLTVAGSPHNICASPGTHCQSVYTVVTVDICNWIISRGGWAALTVFDIMQMVAAYLGQISLGFTITVGYIMGAVAYYLNNRLSGNNLTGCTFTI